MKYKLQKPALSTLARLYIYANRFYWLVATVFSLSIISILATPSTILAQSYSAGYKKYTMGDFPGAERALKAAIPRSRSTANRANIMKLLGIAQYMQGKSRDATYSFQQALKYNSKISISSNEVLNSSVISFFSKVKRSYKPKKRQAQRKTSSRRPSKRGPRYGKPVKTTTINIRSNAPRASILIDGIIAGSTNENIEVSKGVITLTLKSKGYKSKSFRVRVHGNKQNAFTLNLSKIKPKRTVIAKKPRRRVKRAKSKSKDLFQEEEPVYREARTTPSRLRRQEVYRDPTLPPPQPSYAAPAPTYQQPYVAPAPAPAYPVYQQPYVAPAPAPTYPAYSQPYAVPEPAPPPPAPDYYSAPKKKRRSKRSSSRGEKRGNTLIALAPFGLGQYQNNDTLLGLFFTASELGAIYYYYSKNQDADKQEKTAKEVLASGENNYTEEQEQEYISNVNKYVSTLRKDADKGLYAFVALWAGGAIEAYINMPKKYFKKKRRRYSSIDDLTSPFILEFASNNKKKVIDTNEMRFGIMITPAPKKKGPALALGLKLPL